MKKIHIKILVLLMTFSIVSCKKTFDNLLNDPNNPTPTSADVDLYLNGIQLSFNGFYQGVSDYGAQLSRQQNWGGPLYQNAYSPPSFDGLWTTAYASIINNANAMIPLAEAQNKFVHAGIAKILKAYTLGTLVDVFNDVPDSQSELGLVNTNPKVDPAATVYADVQSLLDAAIVDLGKPNAIAVQNDLFYGSDAKNEAADWIALANTLKLKFYMQTRLVDNTVGPKIQALVTANKLITSPSQDFQFKYGTSTTPDSRHPHYAADYTVNGNGEYLSNYFMWVLAVQKYNGATNLTGDPRLRYYFYRSINGIADLENPNTTPCFPNSQYGNSTFPAWYPPVPTETPYCLVGSKGYYGRDHGDNSGAPPDNSYRTAWGVYPAGGQFDANQPSSATTSDHSAVTTASMGGLGAGISPIWLSSYTDFLEAEAVSAGLITGNAQTLMAAGVDASITKVLGFPATVNVSPDPNYVPTATQVSAYETLVNSNYASASTAKDKLNVIMTEYYIALWGNGVEAYNNLRRTGMPENLQPAVTTATPGIFMYSFFYPSVYENRNLNAAPQKNPGVVANHVFWDNNPDNFVK